MELTLETFDEFKENLTRTHVATLFDNTTEEAKHWAKWVRALLDSPSVRLAVDTDAFRKVKSGSIANKVPAALSYDLLEEAYASLVERSYRVKNQPVVLADRIHSPFETGFYKLVTKTTTHLLREAKETLTLLPKWEKASGK